MLETRKMIFLKFWFPVIVYSGIIFWVSGLANVKIPLDVRFADKWVHVVEFIPFGFLIARAISQGHPHLTRARFLGIIFACSFLYGLSDEYHQSFVVGRSSDFLDTLADALGGIIGGCFHPYNGEVK